MTIGTIGIEIGFTGAAATGIGSVSEIESVSNSDSDFDSAFESVSAGDESISGSDADPSVETRADSIEVAATRASLDAAPTAGSLDIAATDVSLGDSLGDSADDSLDIAAIGASTTRVDTGVAADAVLAGVETRLSSAGILTGPDFRSGIFTTMGTDRSALRGIRFGTDASVVSKRESGESFVEDISLHDNDSSPTKSMGLTVDQALLT